MRRDKIWWAGLLALVLLVAPGCTDSDLDDPDDGAVVMQITDLDTPSVEGETVSGICTESGQACLSNGDCDPEAFPGDTCPVDPSDPPECTIPEWTATLASALKNELADASPFNDISMSNVEITYDFESVADPEPYNTGLTGVIPPGGTAQVVFKPITDGRLAAVVDADEARTADVTLVFTGRTEEGSRITRTTRAQLFIEACGTIIP